MMLDIKRLQTIKPSMKTLSHNGLNIVIACDKLNERCSIQESILENNLNHRITCIYTNGQLVDYLMKKGGYTACPEPLPDCIPPNFSSSADDVLSTITQIMYFEELRTIPVFIAAKNFSSAEKRNAPALGEEHVYDINDGYEQLNVIIDSGTGNIAA